MILINLLAFFDQELPHAPHPDPNPRWALAGWSHRTSVWRKGQRPKQAHGDYHHVDGRVAPFDLTNRCNLPPKPNPRTYTCGKHNKHAPNTCGTFREAKIFGATCLSRKEKHFWDISIETCECEHILFGHIVLGDVDWTTRTSINQHTAWPPAHWTFRGLGQLIVKQSPHNIVNVHCHGWFYCHRVEGYTGI